MDNYLDTGGVLPSGLLSGTDFFEKIAGFNKTYKNYPLRMGIVNNIYAYNDPNNFTKLCTEYDVLVFEQNEDRGSTIINYKNCIASDGLGSIADFFEKNFRVKTVNSDSTGNLNISNQNGAVVTLLCLDGVSEKAVIIGGINHPNRQTLLSSADPQLYSEYNGVAVAVNPDGSTSLTFKGATDSYGNPTNPSQGNTEVQIQTDGSFQVSHSTATFSMAKSGVVTITANSDISVTAQGNANVTAQGDTNINTTGTTNINSTGPANIISNGTTTIDGSMIELGQGATEAVIKGDTFKNIYNNHTHLFSSIPTSPPDSPMDPSLSTKVFTD